MSEPWLPPAHGSERGGLQRRVARGLTWTFAQSWGVQGINFVVFVVLARLLAPSDFGLVALAAVFVAFAQLVVDQGLGDALIHRSEVTRRQIDTAFWASLATGALLTAALVLLAGPISTLVREPRLEPMLVALSITFLLAALSSIQVALLRRELRFRSLAIRALIGTVGGGVIGVTMAFLGFGAWSLIGQQIGAAALALAALWGVSPWRPSWQWSREDLGQLFGYGVHVMASDVLSFLSRNVDNLLIGTFLGAHPLGLYAVGYRILRVTHSLLVTVARRITFPAFARLQHDPERMTRAYFRVSRTGALVILPAYIALAIVAPELTVALFGTRWAESGPVAAILFLIGPVLTVQAFSGAFLNAAGRPDVVFRFSLITTVVNVVGFALAVSFGILAVAAAFVLRGYLLLPLNLYWTRVYAGVSVRRYLVQLRWIAIGTILMSLAMLAVKFGIGTRTSPALLVAAELATGAATFVIGMWFMNRSQLVEAVGLMRQILPGSRRARRAEGDAVPAGHDGGPGVAQ